MTIKHIPEEGENFPGYIPAKEEVLHLTWGSATTNDVVVGETGVYTLVNVTRPIVVFGLWTQIATAFTSSVTFTLGDSSTADLFLADTTMNPEATGAVLVASTGLSVPYVYAAGQDILLTQAGATVAAGLGNLYIKYAILED